MRHVIVLNSDTMGKGSDELGGRLIVKFLHQLAGITPAPDAIVFYNGGVRLLAAGSAVLPTLQQLERDGIELIACGTCVEHFGLAGRTGAGRVSDMREIATTLMAAERVVTI